MIEQTTDQLTLLLIEQLTQLKIVYMLYSSVLGPEEGISAMRVELLSNCPNSKLASNIATDIISNYIGIKLLSIS